MGSRESITSTRRPDSIRDRRVRPVLNRFQPVSDPIRTGPSLIAGRTLARTVSSMDDTTYSLSELSRRSGRSKMTLTQMLHDGTLDGLASTSGRREWRITRTAAQAAGLTLKDDRSIDAAVRTCLTEELDPIAQLIAERLDVLDERLDRIEGALSHSHQGPDDGSAAIGTPRLTQIWRILTGRKNPRSKPGRRPKTARQPSLAE